MLKNFTYSIPKFFEKLAHKNLSALHEMAQNYEFCGSRKVWNVVKERRKEKEEREEEKTNKQTNKQTKKLSDLCLI